MTPRSLWPAIAACGLIARRDRGSARSHTDDPSTGRNHDIPPYARVRALSRLLALPLSAPLAASAQIAVSANDEQGRAGRRREHRAGRTRRPTRSPSSTSTSRRRRSSPRSTRRPAWSARRRASRWRGTRVIALVTAATEGRSGRSEEDRPRRQGLGDRPQGVAAGGRRRTVEAGAGAAGVAINRAGNLALVANRSEGTVSVFTIVRQDAHGGRQGRLGDAKSGPSAVAILARRQDRAGEPRRRPQDLGPGVDGTKVEYTKRDIRRAAALPLDISSRGDVAVVANIGIGSGDADTASLIDLQAKPPRVVDTVTVGQTPEGLEVSPGRPLRRRDGDERLEQAEELAVLQRQRLGRRSSRVDGKKLTKVDRGQGRPLVPGRRLEQGQSNRCWSSAWWRRRSRCSASTARSSSRPARSRSAAGPPASARRSREPGACCPAHIPKASLVRFNPGSGDGLSTWHRRARTIVAARPREAASVAH